MQFYVMEETGDLRVTTTGGTTLLVHTIGQTEQMELLQLV